MFVKLTARRQARPSPTKAHRIARNGAGGSRRAIAAAVTVLFSPFVPLVPGAQAAPITLVYEASLGPLPVFEAEVALNLQSGRFNVSSAIKPVEMFSKLYDLNLSGEAAGQRTRTSLRPESYTMASKFQQERSLVRIAYRDQGRRAVRVEPMKAGQTTSEARDAVDPLSALAQLVANVADTGTCPGRISVFDGWRTFAIDVETGPESLTPRHPRAAFAGPALECRFTVDPAALSRGANDYVDFMREGVIYLGEAVPSAPRVPVFVMTGDVGNGVKLYLRGATR